MTEDPELTALLRRFESGIAETNAKWRSQGTVIIIGSVVTAGIAAARQIWFLVPVCLLFGVSEVCIPEMGLRQSVIREGWGKQGSAAGHPERRRGAGTQARGK